MSRIARCIVGVLLATAVVVGAVRCGSADNGGVIQGPTTSAAPRTGGY